MAVTVGTARGVQGTDVSGPVGHHQMRGGWPVATGQAAVRAGTSGAATVSHSQAKVSAIAGLVSGCITASMNLVTLVPTSAPVRPVSGMIRTASAVTVSASQIVLSGTVDDD